MSFPGAVAPARVRDVDAHGVRISVKEWGDEAAPPLLLAHGGFDFARTFDVFAPQLVAGGWRVVAWDQRGHGDSEHAALYSWDADVRDAVAVLDTVSQEPVPVMGHSKGGSVILHLASTLPHRVSRVVNMDGLPSQRNWPDVPDHMRTKLMAGELGNWLDLRRAAADAIRKPGTVEELAGRRSRMNPRMPEGWLEYLVTVGGREDRDGWRWKIDPSMRLGGFGPWRPEWAMRRLSLLPMPVLAILGMQPEVMGWGTLPEDVEANMPPWGEVVALDDVGHFVHIEQPQRLAELALEFLARPNAATAPSKPTVMLRHNRVDLALHCLREGEPERRRAENPVRPLLLLHGLGERIPAEVPDVASAWPGPVWGLDFTGHGASTIPKGGGYFCELLMADVDMALARLGEITIYGRGLGGYVGLLIAGARADLVRGLIIDDGPGLGGGGAAPASAYLATEPFTTAAPPDPYALLELSKDVRPPDYATTFARQAATLSGLETAVAVVGAVRPPWLEAVANEPGVEVMKRADAIAHFA